MANPCNPCEEQNPCNDCNQTVVGCTSFLNDECIKLTNAVSELGLSAGTTYDTVIDELIDYIQENSSVIDLSGLGTSCIGTGGSIEQYLANMETQVCQNESDIATNEADIATNTADIATNTADIATNTSDISGNASDISTLQTEIDNVIVTTNSCDYEITDHEGTTINIPKGKLWYVDSSTDTVPPTGNDHYGDAIPQCDGTHVFDSYRNDMYVYDGGWVKHNLGSYVEVFTSGSDTYAPTAADGPNGELIREIDLLRPFDVGEVVEVELNIGFDGDDTGIQFSPGLNLNAPRYYIKVKDNNGGSMDLAPYLIQPDALDHTIYHKLRLTRTQSANLFCQQMAVRQYRQAYMTPESTFVSQKVDTTLDFSDAFTIEIYGVTPVTGALPQRTPNTFIIYPSVTRRIK